MDTIRILVRRAARRWVEKRRAGQTVESAVEPKTIIKQKAIMAEENVNAEENVLQSPESRQKAMQSDTHPLTQVVKDDKEQTEVQLERFLARHYRFRYNVLTEITEYAPVGAVDGCLPGVAEFRPVTVRSLNSFCIAAHRAGISCWDRDMTRLINSSTVPEYHPFTDYFERLPAWDGKDRIDALAARVSDCDFWKRHFHRWLLAVVAQWMGCDGLYANSVAPLLVSTAQGMGKSAFCRALLPPELRAYYSDCVDLNAPESIGRKLTELGLLSLDEFDRISSKRQPQLKNLMQLSSMNLRKAYCRHAGARRRIASFIGTSNSRELLTDPSGSRRFICVEVERPIDCTGIEHDMIFAQLKEELAQGERYWFSAEEEAELHAHNLDFYRTNPTEDMIRRRFRIPAPGETPALLALDEVMELIRKRNRYALRGVSTQAFARALLAAGFTRRHTREGNRYEMLPRDVV